MKHTIETPQIDMPTKKEVAALIKEGHQIIDQALPDRVQEGTYEKLKDLRQELQ